MDNPHPHPILLHPLGLLLFHTLDNRIIPHRFFQCFPKGAVCACLYDDVAVDIPQ